MGRTNPTYRDYLRKFEQRCNAYRRALRHQHQEHFDRVLERAQHHADAAGYMNSATPETTILLSICLSQEIELQALEDRLEAHIEDAD